MNCERFEELAPQIAHQELCDAEILRDANDHAASCPSCNALLIEAREVASSLSVLAAHDKPLQASTHMESLLRAAFVRGHATDVQAERAPGTIAFPRSVFVGATFRWAALSLLAAAIVVAALLVPRMINRNTENNHAVVIPPAAPAAVPIVSPIVPKLPTAAPPAERKFTAVAHHQKQNHAQQEKTLTGFLPLPFADDLSTVEYGAVVRLKMSRADLAWLGLPVPINDSGEKIVADLFVSGNGVPEAIRLVR